ncbi:unnamed protein product [Closterium sp. NIES-53]
MTILCVVPVVMGLILVAAAVFQKTGTSDVQSWPSSSEGDEADPYEKMQAEHMDDMDNEEADIEDLENGEEGLTRPAYSDPSEFNDPILDASRDSPARPPPRTPSLSIVNLSATRLGSLVAPVAPVSPDAPCPLRPLRPACPARSALSGAPFAPCPYPPVALCPYPPEAPCPFAPVGPACPGMPCPSAPCALRLSVPSVPSAPSVPFVPSVHRSRPSVRPCPYRPSRPSGPCARPSAPCALRLSIRALCLSVRALRSSVRALRPVCLYVRARADDQSGITCGPLAPPRTRMPEVHILGFEHETFTLIPCADPTTAHRERVAHERAAITAWKARDATACIALSSFLPESEEAHFTQVRSARELLTAIKAHHSTPTTVSLGRLFLPFLFPDLASFERSSDLIAHLRSLDLSYRAACTDAQLALLPPPMAITIYFIATSLPDRLATVRDTILLKHPSELTIAVLEAALKDIESNLRSVASASGAVPPHYSRGGQGRGGKTGGKGASSRGGRGGGRGGAASGGGGTGGADDEPSALPSGLPAAAGAAPPATADGGTCSQWLSRDATARLAIRNHLPVAECTHFGQHRTAQALYDAVVARYSSPATTALNRLLLPYLFPKLSAFATVVDLVTHLCTIVARYRATVPAEFLATNQPPMFITAVHHGLPLAHQGGGEFSSDLLQDFCRWEGTLQSFMLLASPQQNGIAERRIGLVMEVARTSMIHVAAPHFLWPFAVRYAAHQLNLWPRVSLPETSPTLRWTGKVGDVLMFRVQGSRAFVRDTSADKVSARAIPCVFLGFFPDAPGWQFYQPTSRHVLPSQDVTFDESVLFYHPLPGTAPVQVADGSGAALGVASGCAEPGGAGSEGAGSGGAEPRGVEPEGAEPRGAASSGGPAGASPGLSSQQLHTGAGGAAVTTGAGSTGGTAATSPGGARTSGAGAAGTGGVGCAGAGDPPEPGAAGAGGAGAGGAGVGCSGEGGVGAAGAGVGGTGAAGAGAAGAGAVDPGAGGARGTVRPRPYFVPLLQQVLGVPSSTGLPPPFLCPPLDQSQPPLQPASPLPAPSPYTEQSGGLTERREPASRPVLPVRTACRTPRLRPPPVPGTHAMALRPSSVPLRVPLPAPPESSLPEVTDPSFESAAASALVDELLDFAAACRLDCATALVAESVSASPLSVEGECALGTDVLEDRQEEFECLAAAVPRFASMLLAPEGDPDGPDIPTPRSYAEAITGPYSSQWVKRLPGSPPAFKARYVASGFSQRQGVDYFQTFSTTPKITTLRVLLHVADQRDYELHSLDFSTAFLLGSLHEEIWLRRPPGFTRTFPAGTQWSLRRPVYGLCEAPREWHDTLRPTHAALGFAPSTADLSLFLRTDTSLPPFNVLVYVDDLVFANADTEALTLVKSELQKRHTCTDLGEQRSYLGLQITRDRARCTITLTQSHMVHQVLQRFGFQFSSPQPTPLSTSHSLSAPPSDESIEPSGLYPELVGCLMYLMTCTRPDLAYPLSLLARYVAPGWHRKVHWDDAKRELHYLCSTSTMGLVLGGRGPIVLIGHADASWVDDSATQRSSQGYTFSLGSGFVSWQSTHSSLVLSSSCEAEIYAGAMAAQELRWLTYLLTDMGEQPRSPLVLTKHIALRYFLARELQQRGQLCLAYVFTTALPPGDHLHFATVLGLLALLFLTCLVTTCSPSLCLLGLWRSVRLLYRSLAHPTDLYHHRLGHPSFPRLCTMSSQRVVLGLPRVLPSLPPSPAPPCIPCVEGRLCATPHSLSLRLATAPFETLHLDFEGPASRPGPEREIFFPVVVDDYSRYTTVFPLAKKSDVTSTLIRWILTTEGARVRLVSCLHSDRGGEFHSSFLVGFRREQGIVM